MFGYPIWRDFAQASEETDDGCIAQFDLPGPLSVKHKRIGKQNACLDSQK